MSTIRGNLEKFGQYVQYDWKGKIPVYHSIPMNCSISFAKVHKCFPSFINAYRLVCSAIHSMYSLSRNILKYCNGVVISSGGSENNPLKGTSGKSKCLFVHLYLDCWLLLPVG